jgi:hypothetical protein
MATGSISARDHAARMQIRIVHEFERIEHGWNPGPCNDLHHLVLRALRGPLCSHRLSRLETDCVAGVVGLELRNPRASHVFEIS